MLQGSEKSSQGLLADHIHLSVSTETLAAKLGQAIYVTCTSSHPLGTYSIASACLDELVAMSSMYLCDLWMLSTAWVLATVSAVVHGSPPNHSSPGSAVAHSLESPVYNSLGGSHSHISPFPFPGTIYSPWCTQAPMAASGPSARQHA